MRIIPLAALYVILACITTEIIKFPHWDPGIPQRLAFKEYSTCFAPWRNSLLWTIFPEFQYYLLVPIIGIIAVVICGRRVIVLIVAFPIIIESND